MNYSIKKIYILKVLSFKTQITFLGHFHCIKYTRQFSTQSQDDREEDSFDSLEKLSSIRRYWLSLDDSTEV